MTGRRSAPAGTNALAAATRQCRANGLAVLTFSLFSNLLVFVGPLYMLQIYDRVLASRSEETLAVLTLLAVALLSVFAMLEIVRARILVRTGLLFDDMTARDVLKTAFGAQIMRPGHNEAEALRDVAAVRDYIGGTAPLSLFDAPWVPVFIAVCFFLHVWLGVVALIGAVIIFALALANEMLTRRANREANLASTAAHRQAAQSLRNAETVKVLGMADALIGRWHKSHVQGVDEQALANDRSGAIIGLFKAVRLMLQVAILGTGALLALAGEITPGVMIAASIIMARALAPVESAVSQWRQFVGARAAYARLDALMRHAPGPERRMALPKPTGKLVLEQLFVAPPGGTLPTVKNLSLTIAPGEVLAIVGTSGAGKTTLARAIVGVWPPASGAVRLDGAEIDQWPDEDLGPHLGYLPQDVELFSGTVAENIARFKKVDAEAVIRAAMTAGAHEMILRLPDGYGTTLGESGRALSGGQRQRIGLARALYGDPRLIVLDEPNSSLDQEGEKALTEAIVWAKKAGRTVIVISHRSQLLSVVDTVAVLADGSLIQHGDPQTVLGAKFAPLRARPPSRSGGRALAAAEPTTR